MPGQTLRVCGSHLGRSEHPDLYLNVWINDSEGRRVHQVDDVRVLPSQTRCVDLSHDAIGLPGEGDSGRLQLAGQVIVTGGPPGKWVMLWAEVFTAETGRTEVGMLLPAVQTCRPCAFKN